MKKDNNKIVDIFIIVGIVFLIGSLFLMVFQRDKTKNNLVDISFSQYSEKMKEDKYNIFLLTSPTCSHCVSYKPYVNSIAEEYNLTVYNIDLTKLDYDQYVLIHDMYSATKDNYNESNIPTIPTPATIITKNGEEVTSILGDIGINGFQNLIKTYGVIQ